MFPVRVMARRCRLPWLLLAVLGALGCERPGSVVIGYAFPYAAAPVVRVAQERIAAMEGDLRIRIIQDTVGGGARADLEVARARRMADLPGIVAVVGPPGSRGSLAAAPVYNDAEIVQVAPLTTSRYIADAGPWTFTLSPNDSVEGAFIARFVQEELRARTVSMLYVGDEYGEGLRDGVAAELERRGVAIQREYLYDDQSDLETLVRAALQPRVPDAVIVAGQAQATAQIARHMEAHAPGIPVVAGDAALRLPALRDRAGTAVASLYAVSFWLPDTADAAYRDFAAQYRQVAGESPNPSDVMIYDALMLLATGIREAGPNPHALRAWLLELGQSRPPYQGLTGPITARSPSLSPTMVRLASGRPVPVYP